MELARGTRLGSYEIVSRIGAGGMGEVFRARDTRLDRSVAIKVLPREFASNAAFKVRFEREARTISQLSHPHICTLHDIGSEQGVDFLVMEFLEGESLAERLARGPLPMHEVFRYGAQISEALGRAHRHGIVHRDLKPGNVMITKDGAKLLDFGLAKPGASWSGTATSQEVAETLQKPLTQEGTILGTFQYMSPEQLEGTEADARSDIFALGALLYEMATGERAFQGKNRTSLIAAIVTGQPRPISELQPMTPPAFEHLVQRCLHKDPEDRWQSAHDVAEELRWISEGGSQVGIAAPLAVKRKHRERLAWTLAALLALSTIALGAWIATRPAPRVDVLRNILALPPGHVLIDAMPALVLSPDGKRLFYNSFKPGTPEFGVFARQLDRFESVSVSGAQNARSLFVSPDGQWIGFIRAGKMHKVHASGGAAIALADISNPRGAAWGTDGFIYYTRLAGGGLWKIAENGGKPVEISKPELARGENSHRWPQVLPDGKHLLLTVRTPDIASFDDAKIAVLPLAGGNPRTIFEGATFARYVPTGHLVFGRGGALHAVRFDLDEMKIIGSPVRIVENVQSFPDNGLYNYTFSQSGALAYATGGGADQATMVRIDGNGARPVTPKPGAFYNPAISPDGKTIAYRLSTANDDIWTLDLERGTMSRLSFEPGDESDPVWTADGRSIIYYSSEAPTEFKLQRRTADGSGEAVTIARDTTGMFPNAVSPDGKLLAYGMRTDKTRSDIWLMSLADGKRWPFAQTPFHESSADFSPDSRWIAHMSVESGKPQVYVRSVAPGGGRWQVSIEAGLRPRWSRDGRWLYWFWGDAFYRVAVTPNGDKLTFGPPQRVFTGKEFSDDFSIGPNNELIALQWTGESTGATGIHYVHNWFEDLKRRVP